MSTEETSLTEVPSTPWNIKLEHRVGDVTYYFHNTDEAKVSQTGKVQGWGWGWGGALGNGVQSCGAEGATA